MDVVQPDDCEALTDKRVKAVADYDLMREMLTGRMAPRSSRIKHHLRIKAFFGTSENAVKTQIWIAVATYVLIAIVKKRMKLPHSLYELLQILSLTMFETTPINQLLSPPPPSPQDDQQLVLL